MIISTYNQDEQRDPTEASNVWNQRSAFANGHYHARVHIYQEICYRLSRLYRESVRQYSFSLFFLIASTIMFFVQSLSTGFVVKSAGSLWGGIYSTFCFGIFSLCVFFCLHCLLKARQNDRIIVRHKIRYGIPRERRYPEPPILLSYYVPDEQTLPAPGDIHD